MRRPNVYQCSAPRARRDVGQEASAHYAPAARATIAVVLAVLREVEANGAATLARHLGQALSEAEGVVRGGDVTFTSCQTKPVLATGATFIAENGEGPGVRLRKVDPA